MVLILFLLSINFGLETKKDQKKIAKVITGLLILRKTEIS